MERRILHWNKHHLLQQATVEEGRVYEPITQPLIAKQEYNNPVS